MPAGRTIGNSGGRLGGSWGEVRGLNGVIVVAPHPDGRRWERTGTVPTLPEELAELLDDASPTQDAASDDVVSAFLAEHTDATRPELLHGWIKALHQHFETGSRHDGAVSVVTGALKESRCGYLAANTVIDTLRQMFNTAATRPPTGGERQRTKRQAADEWPRDETRNRGFRLRSLRCRAPKLPRYMSIPVLRIRNVRRRQAVAGLGVAQLPPISQTIRRRRR